MTTFHLSITLDPATAMHSGDDVQRALALTGADVANRFDGLTLPEHLEGVIRDTNGNAVGQWSTAQTQTAEQIADSFAGVGHALDWEDGPKRRAYIIHAVHMARGETSA